MKAILWVGSGGFIGSVLRYLISGWLFRRLDQPWFPVGTLAVNILALAVVALLWMNSNPGQGGMQFVERHTWIPTLGVEYHVGLDGLGLVMLMLAALVIPMSVLASEKVEQNVPLYCGLFLFLQAGLFGAFTALNFFHWFLFWELSLIPAFFLIKLWGGLQRSEAALQFFVYTMVGSIALLLAFLAVYQATGTFDLIALAEKGRTGELASAMLVKLGWYGLTGKQLALIIFLLAFLGFAVKTPLMPSTARMSSSASSAPGILRSASWARSRSRRERDAGFMRHRQ